MELFRKQAIDHQRQRLHGEVTFAPPLSAWVLTGLLLALVSGITMALIFGQYARKETVTGWVVPDKGLVALRARHAGLVAEVHVQEGDHVRKGAVLVTLSKETSLKAGGESSERLLKSFQMAEQEIKKRLVLIQKTYDNEVRELTLRRENLRKENLLLHQQKKVQTERTKLAGTLVRQIDGLVQSGIISKLEQQRRQENFLAHRQNLEKTTQTILQQDNSIASITSRLEAIPLEQEEKLSLLRGELAVLQGNVTTSEIQEGHSLVRAPVTGRVAALHIAEGQSITPQTLQLVLLPEGGQLQAELFAPTRAAGFIKTGQKTRLLYDAFPFQKFGSGRGEITRISKTILNPTDINIPLNLQEPVYRLSVKLHHQSVNAYGTVFPLQSGMTLRADIILEKRRLWQVVFDPLLANLK